MAINAFVPPDITNATLYPEPSNAATNYRNQSTSQFTVITNQLNAEITNKFNSVVDGSSGGDNVKMTPITEFGSANTAQSILEAVPGYITNNSLSITNAANTYETKTNVSALSNTVNTVSGVANSALTIADNALPTATAANTYLSIANATNTYLSSANATNTYLSVTNAANTYLTITNASTTYLNITNAAAMYLSTANAINTYLSITNAANTYYSKTNTYNKTEVDNIASNFVLGQVSNGSVTYAMLNSSVTNVFDAINNSISAINNSINAVNSSINSINSNLDVHTKDILNIKLRQSGLNLDPNAWSDTLEDTTGINTNASSGYTFDVSNKSLKVTQAGTVADTYTKLLLKMEGTNASTNFVDSSNAPKTVTPSGNAQISTVRYKYGTASGVFDGNGDYLTVPNDTDLILGTGDFTIDTWIYTAGNANQCICTKGGSAATNGFTLFISSANKVSLNSNATGLITQSDTIPLTEWFHVALVRATGVTTLYVNGVNKGSTSTAMNITDTSNFIIGYELPLTRYYINGNLDDFQFSKGIARWTSNFDPLVTAGTATVLWNAVTSTGTLTKAIVEAMITLGTGTSQFSFSRDGGTTFTNITLDTITSITSQPTGTSIVLKWVGTGNVELLAVAWGGEV